MKKHGFKNQIDSTKNCSNAFILTGKRKLLLIHNKKLNLWLPPGGNIKKSETPISCALRELKEEVPSVPVEDLCPIVAMHPPLLFRSGVLLDKFPFSEKNQLPTATFFLKNKLYVVHNFLWIWPAVDCPEVDINEEVDDYIWQPVWKKTKVKTTDNILFLIDWINNSYQDKYKTHYDYLGNYWE